MYEPIYTNAFKADFKRLEKRGYDVELLEKIIDLLVNKKPLPKKHREHILKGKYGGLHECHVKPDWLLVYYYEGKAIVFARTGTHADLF